LSPPLKKDKQKKQEKCTKNDRSDGRLVLEKLPRPFLTEFIGVYKAHECLWKPNSPNYYNRKIKRAAWQKLVEKYREVDPKCNRNLIQRKISSLRSTFRKEYTKVERLKTSWQPHVPKLWYYDQLYFIVEVPPHKNSKETTQADKQQIKEEIEENDQDSVCSEEENDRDQDGDDTIECRSYSENSYDPLLTDNEVPDDTGTGSSTAVTCPLVVVKNEEDELYLTGQAIAAKLKTMEKEQQIIAEKLIFDVLCYGRLGKLNMSTKLQNFENS
jgi:Alcohol dehydrogenase transcription factor Myb/SANT-like